jgi:hypothetical protein
MVMKWLMFNTPGLEQGFYAHQVPKKRWPTVFFASVIYGKVL